MTEPIKSAVPSQEEMETIIESQDARSQPVASATPAINDEAQTPTAATEYFEDLATKYPIEYNKLAARCEEEYLASTDGLSRREYQEDWYKYNAAYTVHPKQQSSLVYNRSFLNKMGFYSEFLKKVLPALAKLTEKSGAVYNTDLLLEQYYPGSASNTAARWWVSPDFASSTVTPEPGSSIYPEFYYYVSDYTKRKKGFSNLRREVEKKFPKIPLKAQKDVSLDDLDEVEALLQDEYILPETKWQQVADWYRKPLDAAQPEQGVVIRGKRGRANAKTSAAKSSASVDATATATATAATGASTSASASANDTTGTTTTPATAAAAASASVSAATTPTAAASGPVPVPVPTSMKVDVLATADVSPNPIVDVDVDVDMDRP